MVWANRVFYAASWFAQQAAEKALKAVYIEQRGEEPPRTHDLLALGRRLGVPVEIAAALETLAPVFDLTRYPDDMAVPPVDAVMEEVTGRHMAATRRIIEWVAQTL